MAKKLAGKVAIVTGASKGIGAGIAEHLGEEGAAVVVNYASDKKGAMRVVGAIKQKGGKAIAVQANMSEPKEIKRLFAEAKKAFKKVDILINNAGVYEFKALEEITADHFYKQFDLNVFGLLMACQEAVKSFGKKGGSIVNISSVASNSRLPNLSVYSATKASVDAITKVLGSELGPKKIRVNSINPGLVSTEGTKSVGITNGDFRKEVEMKTPLGRIGETDDIAPAVAFLVSDDASWITGESLFISGGYR